MNKCEFLKNKYYTIDYLIAIIVFYSNITYFPFLTSYEFINTVTYFLWGVLFLWVVLSGTRIPNSAFVYVMCVLAFDVYVGVMEIFSLNNYFYSRFVYPVNMCLFLLIIGIGIAKNITKEKLVFYFKSYINSALLLGIIIYFQYFRNFNWVDSMSYLVIQKNGIAMIFLIAIIFCVYIGDNISKIKRTLLISAFAMMLLMLKSRAVILGLFLVIIYWFLKLNRKKKILFILLSCFLTFYFVEFTTVPNYLVDNLLFNNRYDMGLDSVSSDRLTHLSIFNENFFDCPILGRGTYYLESFPLAALMSYGIIGSFPLFILSFLPVVSVIKNKEDIGSLKIGEFLIAIWMIYFSNGIFEELAPFGPGVKCYILWVLTGIYLGHNMHMLSGKPKKKNA